MATFGEHLVSMAGGFGGKKAELLAKFGLCVADAALSRKKAYETKLAILSSAAYSVGGQYVETILKNFVSRKVTRYGSEKKVTIQTIQRELKRPRYSRHLILTGVGGSGKSTALKWLFLNSTVKDYTFIFLYAKMFTECTTLEEVLQAISDIIDGQGSCIIFFDGLDELSCIKGNGVEFGKIIDFINKKSVGLQKGALHRFVISTRPEHFEFHKRIKGKPKGKNLDPYQVFEFQLLELKESYQICKSIKQLCKLDIKADYDHFKDKWPMQVDKSHPLSEQEYLTLLRRYLEETDSHLSLLTSPLLCRYAYQIICEWNATNLTNLNKSVTQSSRIQFVLRAYIKWEFHDSDRGWAEEDDTETLQNQYINEVLDFLTILASEANENGCIAKYQWEMWKAGRGISTNAALCVLQEIDGEHYAFIHQAFLDYFLARYFVMRGQFSVDNDRKEARLEQLLASNLTFATMYVEQIAEHGNDLEQRVCKTLLNRHKSFEYLADLASGNYSFIYQGKTPFTVEEYFSVFPAAHVEYAGVNLRLDTFKDFIASGILEISNPSYLEGLQVQDLTSDIRITGIKLGISVKYTACLLNCIYHKNIIDIGAYIHLSYSGKDFFRFLHDPEIIELLRTGEVSLRELKNDSRVQKALQMMKENTDAISLNEMLTISNYYFDLAYFMGWHNNYWCFFDGSTLHVYQMTPENASRMTDLLNIGLTSKHKLDFISLYYTYSAHVGEECNLISNMIFDTTEQVKIVFNSNPCLREDGGFLARYYTVHWNNCAILQAMINNPADGTGFISQIEKVQLITSHFDYVDKHIDEISDNKLLLCFSDEKLITYYILQEFEKMEEYAKATLEICKKHEHIKGLELRRLLLDANKRKKTSFVHNFAREYIWMIMPSSISFDHETDNTELAN